MNQHSNYIGFNVGGGMNTLMYNPADGTWNPKLGFLGELKYMHFFGMPTTHFLWSTRPTILPISLMLDSTIGKKPRL